MLKFSWHQFNELSTEQLYKVLALRSDIFVVEQNCIYLDPDGKDLYALHLLGIENQQLVAYIRLFLPTDVENYIVFGRVVTARSARSKGYGKLLMQEMVKYCDINYPNTLIKCSAQHYLLEFYESFGFKSYGEIYQEDDIPHIAMERKVF